jgi:transposase-like protein
MDKIKPSKVFSDSFKRAKVALIESGKTTKSQVSREFDVSYTSVAKWVNKYGKIISPDRIVIETDSDYLKLVKVQKDKEDLERLVGRQQIKIDYYETLIQIANEHHSLDIEKEFKKK